MVDAAQFRALPGAELRRVGFAVFEDGEIDVAVAEPDAALPGRRRAAIELGQAEMRLVELGGLRRIVGDESDMLDASHLSPPAMGAPTASAGGRGRTPR